jgi:hypothetical protein
MGLVAVTSMGLMRKGIVSQMKGGDGSYNQVMAVILILAVTLAAIMMRVTADQREGRDLTQRKVLLAMTALIMRTMRMNG